MNAVAVIRDGVQWGHQLLEMVMGDVTDEQARWAPPGLANPIGALYAHALLSEDAIVNGMLQGGAPLFATSWAGQAGVEAPQFHLTVDWARGLKPDLAALRQYGPAVAASTVAYLNGLTDSGLDRQVDLSRQGLGSRSIGWALNALVAAHLNNMAGEISALKGVQGARGYPF
jgi:hypothetical protein